jgi:hypothetical protein
VSMRRRGGGGRRSGDGAAKGKGREGNRGMAWAALRAAAQLWKSGSWGFWPGALEKPIPIHRSLARVNRRR